MINFFIKSFLFIFFCLFINLKLLASPATLEAIQEKVKNTTSAVMNYDYSGKLISVMESVKSLNDETYSQHHIINMELEKENLMNVYNQALMNCQNRSDCQVIEQNHETEENVSPTAYFVITLPVKESSGFITQLTYNPSDIVERESYSYNLEKSVNYYKEKTNIMNNFKRALKTYKNTAANSNIKIKLKLEEKLKEIGDSLLQYQKQYDVISKNAEYAKIEVYYTQKFNSRFAAFSDKISKFTSAFIEYFGIPLQFLAFVGPWVLLYFGFKFIVYLLKRIWDHLKKKYEEVKIKIAKKREAKQKERQQQKAVQSSNEPRDPKININNNPGNAG